LMNLLYSIREFENFSREILNQSMITSSSSLSSPKAKFFRKPRKNLKKLYQKNDYQREVEALKSTIPHWDDMYCISEVDTVDVESRVEEMIRVDVVGSALADKYAWAIPDQRALKILNHFSPIIEIGCGKKFWGSLIEQQYHSEAIGFDSYVSKKTWSEVLRGGPEVLLEEKYHQHTLFLCYPDEQESMAISCLENYTGEYVVHVGELLSTGATLSYPQAPWGRTSSPEFQIALAEEFHCILTASIPRFPFSNDCISVWKRTQWVHGKEYAMGGTDKENEMDMWASIPVEERMPTDSSAPCVSHLLK
jgi:hypothetical protein